MIIDLDAHQGNGHERDFINDKNVFIVDMYNHNIYPADRYAKEAINVDISVWPRTHTTIYLEKLRDRIPNAIDSFKPDFILYNAGTDCMEGDPLGNL